MTTYLSKCYRIKVSKAKKETDMLLSNGRWDKPALVDCGGRWYEVPSNEPEDDYIEDDLPEPEPSPLCRIETSEDGEF